MPLRVKGIGILFAALSFIGLQAVIADGGAMASYDPSVAGRYYYAESRPTPCKTADARDGRTTYVGLFDPYFYNSATRTQGAWIRGHGYFKPCVATTLPPNPIPEPTPTPTPVDFPAVDLLKSGKVFFLKGSVHIPEDILEIRWSTHTAAQDQIICTLSFTEVDHDRSLSLTAPIELKVNAQENNLDLFFRVHPIRSSSYTIITNGMLCSAFTRSGAKRRMLTSDFWSLFREKISVSVER